MQNDQTGGGRGGELRPNPDRRNWKEPETLDPASFPHPPPKGRGLPGTIANLKFLLAGYNITVCYDVIRKRLYIGADWFEDARLPDLRIHDLRHSAASFMINSGVDPRALFLSHRQGSTTGRHVS